MVRAFLVALLLLGATSTARATAVDDVEACRAAAKPGGIKLESAFAAGYCTGIVEATMFNLPVTGNVCLPKGVTTGQGLQVLVKYMDDHPKELHEQTVRLAARAIVQAWPCS
jgi:hypothetical protein